MAAVTNFDDLRIFLTGQEFIYYKYNMNLSFFSFTYVFNIVIIFSPAQGQEVHGVADYVLTRGRVVVEEGDLKAVSGSGQFVPTPAYCPAVYARTPARDAARAWKKVRLG